LSLTEYRQLESNLYCKIISIADQSRIQGSCHRPTELTLTYATLPRPYAIGLCSELELRFGNLEILSGLFRYCHRVASELGAWCAQRVWTLVLAEEESKRLESKVQHKFLFNAGQKDDTARVETEINQLRNAQNLVSTYKRHDPVIDSKDLSSKVLELHAFLMQEFKEPSDHKCIIFVERRFTAHLLSELFSKIGTEHMRAGTLIGAGTGEVGDLKTSFRKQVLIMTKFRKGLLNCLVC
jgi:endoribonuclease Dicer